MPHLPITPGGNWALRALTFRFFFTSYFLNLFFIFERAGSSLWCRLLSSCSKRGLLFGCSAWASHCSGSACCRAQAVARAASSVAVPGL